MFFADSFSLVQVWFKIATTIAPLSETIQFDSSCLELYYEVWHETGSWKVFETWFEGPTDPPRMLHYVHARGFNRFYPPKDENVYNMKLRELLSR